MSVSHPSSSEPGRSPVRIGVIGAGKGALHARDILAGKVPRLRLTALCDRHPDRFTFDPGIRRFSDSSEMIRSGEVDAVLIATPHYSHTGIGIDALEQGQHVLVEKPISVHKADCERLIAAHQSRKKQVFAAMLNQRTDPGYRKIRELVQSGDLGEIQRITWIITDWFRTEAYYASSSWRATWAGEGGGVLLNQCLHNLDLLQWIFGMPASVHAFCRFGRYHDIEVEDEVTAFLQFRNGSTGVFITSTGEAPGTNRLEITAGRGKLVYEDKHLSYTRNEIDTAGFSRSSPDFKAKPATSRVSIPVSGHAGQHVGIMENFADAILDGTPLIAPGEEGIYSVELANAMLYSTFTGRTIELPLDASDYERHLTKLIAGSKLKKESAS